MGAAVTPKVGTPLLLIGPPSGRPPRRRACRKDQQVQAEGHAACSFHRGSSTARGVCRRRGWGTMWGPAFGGLAARTARAALFIRIGSGRNIHLGRGPD